MVIISWTRSVRLGAISLGGIAAVLVLGCTSSGSNKQGSPGSGPSCIGECVSWGVDSGTRNDAAGRVESGTDSGDVLAPKDSGPPKPCEPQPLPPDVPEGWQEYPFVDCQFRLYVPSSKEYLPPPLTWEPCSSKTGPLPYVCRQIQMDWPSQQPYPYALGGQSFAYVDSDGKVVIQLRKAYERPGAERLTAFMGLVLEADGPVRQAVWRNYSPYMNSHQLSIGQRSVAPGKSSWLVYEWRAGDPYRTVAMGGNDDLPLPPILSDKLKTDPDVVGVVAGPQFYVETGHRYRVRKWDGTDMGLAAYDAPAYSPPQWVGPTMLFALESPPNYRVVRWTEEDGTRVLVDVGPDNSKGAAGPGSDGKDLVWLQGEGRESGMSEFPERWVMTSKYSTEPSEIVPRRLTRWAQRYIGTDHVPPPVGCGYAAFHYALGVDSVEEAGLLIVRLSDGVSWKLPSVSQSPRDAWGAPIAITCDEVFAGYSGYSLDTIRRVRLDSLGPGTPP